MSYQWRPEACSHQKFASSKIACDTAPAQKGACIIKDDSSLPLSIFFSLDQSLYLPVPAIKRKWLNQLIDTNSCTHMPQLYNPKPQEWSFQYCLPLTSKCLSANTSSQFHSKTILWSLTCSSLTLYQDHKLDPIFAMQPLMLQVRGISWENIRKQEICLEETNQQTND